MKLDLVKTKLDADLTLTGDLYRHIWMDPLFVNSFGTDEPMHCEMVGVQRFSVYALSFRKRTQLPRAQITT